jgi:hypothetical protein
MLDLIGAIALTVGAAITIATLTFAVAAAPWTRLEVAAGLSAWFGLVAVLGATYALHYERGYGTLVLGTAVFLPVIGLALAFLTLPRLREVLDRIPLPALIGVNVLRVLGVVFVLLYAAGRLPAPFAPAAGWGDIFVGLTALPVAWAARKGEHGGLVLAWNTLGLADLVNAIILGVVSSPGPLQVFMGEPNASIMSLLPWVLIPCFLVPLLILTHLAVFYRLMQRSDRPHNEARAMA